MIEIKEFFPEGLLRPLDRGVVFYRKSSGCSLEYLIEEAVGDAYSLSGGTKLKGITIHVTIEEAEKA